MEANYASSLIFVGVGSSSGTPKISCLSDRENMCEVCVDALKPGSKNRRRNPSLLIVHNNKHILIDCGKTFRESIVECMDKHHDINFISAVIITHSHADACLGLDDIREFTEQNKIPVYTRERDLPEISRIFPYIVDPKRATGSGYVAQIEFPTFNETKPFEVEGITFTPLVVEHGPNNTALGYHFGKVVYISDVSAIPSATRELIHQVMNGQQIELLIIDSLRIDQPNAAHFSMSQALVEIRYFKPKKAYLVGLSHEFNYEKINAQLKKLKEKEGLDVELPFDGLRIPFPL